MNKSEFIDTLAAYFEGNKKAASQALDAVIDTITREMSRGEKVAITGFGAFEKAIRPARMVRNPRTGERLRAKRTAVPKFRPGADLKAVVSGAKKAPPVTVARAATAATSAAASPRKTATKAASATKSAAKSAARKATGKKSPAKRTTAKKSTAKKSTAKKASPSRSSAKKTAAKASPARKTAARKTTAKRAPARKSTAKKTTARKTTR